MEAGEVVLGRFRVLGPGGRGLLDAAEVGLGAPSATGAAAVRLVALPGAPPSVEPSEVLARALRYAVGVPGLSKPAAVGREGELTALAYPATPTLDDRIARGPMEPPEVAACLRRIVRALEALHGQGMAHGCLRPDLIGWRDGQVILGGYGVAALADAIGGPAAIRDALPEEYRAPELQGASPSRPETWTDVHALGRLALELLAGRRLPSTASTVEVRVAPSVAELIDETLATSPGGRPGNLDAWIGKFEVAAHDAVPDELDAAVSEAPPMTSAPEPAVRTSPQFAEVAAPEAPSPRPAATTAALGTPDSAEPPPAAPDPPETSADRRARALAQLRGEEAPPSPSPAPAPPGSPPAEPTPPVAAPELGPPDRKSSSGTVLAAVGIIGGVMMLLLGGVGAFAYLSVRAPTPPKPVATAPPVPSATVATPDGGRKIPELAPPHHDPPPTPKGPSPPGTVAAGPSLFDAESSAALPLDSTVPIQGTRDAFVTVLVFGDLRCPHTGRSLQSLEDVAARMKGEIRLAWRHRPLSTHPAARDYALVAEGIYRDFGASAFWKFAMQTSKKVSKDRSLEHAATDLDVLRRDVRAAGVDGSRVAAWRSDPELGRRVDADVSLGARFMVHATPTHFINGSRVDGRLDMADLTRRARAEARSARSTLVSGVAHGDLYAHRVRKNLINLGPEVPERTCAKVGRSPSRGATDALVTIVEFSDFECEYCARVLPTLDGILARHAGDVRLVWKHFPLDNHRNARPAALLSIEARRRGGDAQFWKAHDLLFDKHDQLSDAVLGGIATKLGLPPDAMEAVRRRDRNADVEADVRAGDDLGLSGVPAFFINGRPLRGAQPRAVFEKLISEEIDAARRLVQNGHPRSRVYEVICGF